MLFKRKIYDKFLAWKTELGRKPRRINRKFRRKGIFYTTARTTPSDSQWSSDTRPACARIGCRPCRPRIARRGPRGARALLFGFCADTERYPKA